MNLRTAIIFVVMFVLVAAGAYFSRVVENYAEQNKDKWQVKKTITIETETHSIASN